MPRWCGQGPDSVSYDSINHLSCPCLLIGFSQEGAIVKGGREWRRVILGYLCPWLPSYGIALGWLCPSTKGHCSAVWRSQLLSRRLFLYESLFVVSGNCPLPSVVTSSGLALSLLVPLYPYYTLINSPLLNKSQFCPSLWLIYSFS